MGRVQFGLIVPENPENPPVRSAYLASVDRLLATVLGHYDSAWCIDHLQGDVLEGWTTLTYLAARHPDLHWGHTVLAQSFRNPALLAKMGATLQFLSGGRFVLGIGAGGQAAELRAYGYDFPPGRTRVAALDEALHIIKALWTEERATFAGVHYRVEAAECAPKPDPLPPIMVGAFRPRMLRIETVTHGVKLSLSIARRTYPKDALVRVTVRLQNISGHTVLVSVSNYLDALVLDSAHQEVYSARDPLLDRALFALIGPGPRPPMSLRSHHALAISYFVILRGPLLQARAMIGTPRKELEIHGPILPLALTHEAPPRVTVMETPALHATITPPPGVSAPPYFVEQTQCADNDISTGRGWQAANSDDLAPEFVIDCTKPGAWVAVAGWLNHPVVDIAWKGQ